ncbi:hypothetical protein CAEBREN_11317 [Caenorhabditis brenneri]|uniref:Uncharacterized protein n=1 Tax=Caenorhabditis brenneri TaxID=135651 RepID=G0PNR4_CAEBE|nr:hypothetical protein CAEBREN_11317 [Caenorhabditis brenneri]
MTSSSNGKTPSCAEALEAQAKDNGSFFSSTRDEYEEQQKYYQDEMMRGLFQATRAAEAIAVINPQRGQEVAESVEEYERECSEIFQGLLRLQEQCEETVHSAAVPQKEETPETGPVGGKSKVKTDELSEQLCSFVKAEIRKAEERALFREKARCTQDRLQKIIGAAARSSLKEMDEFIIKELSELRQEVEKLHARQDECFHTTLNMIEAMKLSSQENQSTQRKTVANKAEFGNKFHEFGKEKGRKQYRETNKGDQPVDCNKKTSSALKPTEPEQHRFIPPSQMYPCAYCRVKSYKACECNINAWKKREIVNKKGLCGICLSDQHKALKCKSRFVCYHCNGQHFSGHCVKVKGVRNINCFTEFYKLEDDEELQQQLSRD